MTNNGSKPDTNERTVLLHGKTVRLKYVSPLLLMDIKKAVKRLVPKPKPPVQVIDGHEETNDANPDYLLSVQDWNQEQGMALIERVLRYGVDVEVDTVALAELRQRAAEDGYAEELPKDDKLCYITRVLIESTADFTELQAAILGASTPTEMGVAEQLETFRGDVQGTGAN